MASEGFFERLGDAGQFKHAVLRKYIQAWLSILGRPGGTGEARELHYVDTHSGPGRYGDGPLGSPLLAMKAAEEIQASGLDFRFVGHFIELEATHQDALLAELDQWSRDTERLQANVVPGDFLGKLPTVLDRIPRDRAVFVFVDPFGYSVPLAAVLGILNRRPRAEVFVTFMSQYIARFASDATKAETLDSVLGGPEWRAYRNRSNVEQDIVSYYCRNLIHTPAPGLKTPDTRLALPIPIRAIQNQSPYHLVHLSQHPKARYEMERAASSLDGQAPMFPFITSADLVESARQALERSGDEAPVSIIAKAIWRETPSYRWMPSISEAIKELHMRRSIDLYMGSSAAAKPRKVGTPPQFGDYAVLKR